MKKLILVILVATATLAASNTTAIGSDVEVSLLKYEPIPAQPSGTVDVWIQVENVGGDAKENLQLEYVDNDPFSLQTGEQRVHDIGTLPGGQEYIARFRTTIADDASTGTADMAVKYTTTSNRYQRFFFPIDIRSRITSLRINSVETRPERIRPGGTGNLTVEVENIADTLVQDVTAKLDLTGSDAPVAPTDSSTELSIDELRPGETHRFGYTVAARYDAEANVYRIPVNLSFTTERGETVANDELLGVSVAAEPSLITRVDSSELHKGQRTGDVTLQFINDAKDEIQFTSFTLLDHRSYERITPSKRFYVGNIRSDDYELQAFNIRAEEDTVTLPINVTYNDAANQRYTTRETLTLDLPDASSGDSSTWWPYVVAVLLIGAGVWWWRRA